ncbi:hypothetical protein [Kitasatospora sp. NPDC006786]|uniref:hypothetical protein n=1 Tax=unclassified Kitasatospora TaxID=2633591 RepID=UPI00340A16CD
MAGTPNVPRPDGRIGAIDAGHQAVCFYRHYPQPVAAVVLRCRPPIPTAVP